MSKSTQLPPGRWADVTGYEGLYAISDDGKVFAFERTFIALRGGRPTEVKLRARLRKLSFAGAYQYVPLIDGVGQKKNHYVHRLVAGAYLNPPDIGADVVRHHDDDPSNNHYLNLAWGTHADNVADKVRRSRQQKGEGVKNSVFSETTVASMRKLHAGGGFTHAQLATQFGVDRATVSYALGRKTWAHVPNP